MAGVVHHVGAFVLAAVKPLGLCQPGVGSPCPRYLPYDLDRAAQFSAAQLVVRVADVDENRNPPVAANVGPALAPDHGIQP